MFDIAETGSEPVVEVCAAKCRLHGFQKEYAIHYQTTSGEEHDEEVRSSRAHYLDVPIIPGEVVAVHIFLRPKMLASRSGFREMALTELNY